MAPTKLYCANARMPVFVYSYTDGETHCQTISLSAAARDSNEKRENLYESGKRFRSRDEEEEEEGLWGGFAQGVW